jgi:hypothetical protein
MILKIYDYDVSSLRLDDVHVKLCSSIEECNLEIMKHHYVLDWDNNNTDLEWEDYIKEYNVDNVKFYENYRYEIVNNDGSTIEI